MNILLICESANDKTSGGKVVRYISKILKEQGHDVKLLVLEKKNKEFYSDQLCSSYQIEFMLFNKQERFFSLFYNTLNINKYIRILENFKPDVVHFASFLNSKPAKLISEAKKSGAKVILQPWTMHFYCEQGFGFRKMKQCTNCIEKGYLEAYKSKCTNAVGLINQFERYILNKVALEADIVLSSNQDLDEILKKYGVSEKKIMRFPVPFDYDLIKKNSLKEEDYYIYYGQMNDHKGGKIILQIFKKSEELKLKIYPMNEIDQKCIDGQNIEIINGKNWSNGLGDAIKKAKVVIIPSMWSTSTEYTLYEAVFLGRPVVVFNVGVHKDILIDNYNARVVKAGSLEEFERAIKELNDDEDLRKKISQNAIITMKLLNNPNTLYDALIHAYS